MNNHWLRLWHDMPTDPKWRTIAARSGRSISEVIAVYVFVLVNASQRIVTQCNARGELCNWCNEDVATSLGIDEEAVSSILQAMQGRVLDGVSVAGWDKRQPKRDDDSNQRVREFREKQKNEKREVTQCNAQDKGIRVKNKNKKYIDQSWFDTVFWPEWPVKENKPKAREAAEKIKPEERDAVIAGLRSQAQRIDSMDTPIHASTWINNRRWEDERRPSSVNGSTNGSNAPNPAMLASSLLSRWEK